MRLLFFCFFTAFLVHPAVAEYRAYELLISNVDKETQRRVITTLDPWQYPGYYPLNPGEVVEYVDSWMCWGSTHGFKPICPRPLRRPAAVEDLNQ